MKWEGMTLANSYFQVEYIGLDDLLGERAIKLVEWPEKAFGRLPQPNRVVRIRVENDGRIIEQIFDNRAATGNRG